jgi:hypothetical protein
MARTSKGWILGVVLAAASQSVGTSSDAHPSHGHARDVVAGGDRKSIAVQPIALHTTALGRCKWRVADDYTTQAGGVHALCPDEVVPIAAGIWRPEYEEEIHPGLVSLFPAVTEIDGVGIDGIYDSAALADDPTWHGEPIEGGTTAESLANAAAVTGAGLHYVENSGLEEPSTSLVLCCESLENTDKNELEDCRYEGEYVPVEPESDPDLPGQWVASLACSSGRIVSGGCYPQFLHASDWALTGSHPYVDGDTLEHPSGAHLAQPTETGWVCRLDREPSIDSPPDNVEGIAVTALCCR